MCTLIHSSFPIRAFHSLKAPRPPLPFFLLFPFSSLTLQYTQRSGPSSILVIFSNTLKVACRSALSSSSSPAASCPAIHASPPCQHAKRLISFEVTKPMATRRGSVHQNSKNTPFTIGFLGFKYYLSLSSILRF